MVRDLTYFNTVFTDIYVDIFLVRGLTYVFDDAVLWYYTLCCASNLHASHFAFTFHSLFVIAILRRPTTQSDRRGEESSGRDGSKSVR